jgi:SAM-dependent methyltransferase
VTGRSGWGYTTDKLRLLYSRHLVGSGIELGPGHHPYVTTLPLTSVRFVDRWTPDENRALFPELGEDAEFPEPDVVANLDTDLLQAFDDASADFVVASHVFEHVANPLALLVDCHRVLRPGGVLLLLLPDMTRTSDRRRPETQVAHLVEEYEGKLREVDEAHMLEYVRIVEDFQGDGEELQERLAHARRRSVHVHCWTEPGFFPVLEYAVGELGTDFELMELVVADDIRGSKEFGYILRRPVVEAKPADWAARLTAARDLLLDTRTAQGEWSVQRHVQAQLAAREQEVKRLRKDLARSEAALARIRGSKPYAVWRAGRWAQRSAAARVAAYRSSR